MTRIFIYDTTLRDGSQGEGVSFSVQDKLLLTRRLDELGVDYIEGGYPLSNPKDMEFFQEARHLPLKHAKVCAFGMTRRKGVAPETDTCLKALLDSGAPVITIVGKTWDLHVKEVLGTTPEENLKMIADSVAHCKQAGREVFYDCEHFFDGLKHNREYALETIKAAERGGASVVILCDTNGGTLPEEIAAGVEAARSVLRCQIGIHCHNDCELAVANSLAAVYKGATQVQGTMNGIGERCGNANLVSVIANLALKRGYEVLSPGALQHLTEASRYAYELANLKPWSNQPFVGQSAFAHKGGMHTHAIAKNQHTYEHMDPQAVGNERRILISELSGQSTILAKTTKYAISHDKAVMARILGRVQDLEHEGYEFEAAEASFDLLVKKVLGQYRPKFERLHYRVNIETHSSPLPSGESPSSSPLPSGERGRGEGASSGDVSPITEATVKVQIGDRIMHTVSDGDGPVNALDGALRKALLPCYPRLAEMQLVDYKVRVVNSRAATAAKVRVAIESRDQTDVWGTLGVSENIIEASWQALVDSIEYKLFKDEEGKVTSVEA